MGRGLRLHVSSTNCACLLAVSASIGWMHVRRTAGAEATFSIGCGAHERATWWDALRCSPRQVATGEYRFRDPRLPKAAMVPVQFARIALAIGSESIGSGGGFLATGSRRAYIEQPWQLQMAGFPGGPGEHCAAGDRVWRFHFRIMNRTIVSSCRRCVT